MESKVEIQTAVPAERHRFHFLDAMRGVAAMLVVFRHAPEGFGAALATRSSFLAVDFFFCLSGFVIAFSYEPRLKDRLKFTSFLVTRLIRLYPIAVLATFFGLITHLLHHSFAGHQLSTIVLIPMLTLLGCLILPFPHDLLFPLDNPMWTLFLELSANLAYGGLVRARWAGTKFFSLVCAAALMGLIAARHLYGTMDLGYDMKGLAVGAARVSFSFLLGVLLYRFYRRVHMTRIHNIWAIITACLLVFLLLAVLTVNWRSYSGISDILSVTIIFPLIILAGAHISLPRGWTAICVVAGTISYPLYLIHQPFLVLCRDLQSLFGPASVPVLGLYCLAMALFAWIVAEYYDAPIRKALSRFFKRFQERSATQDSMK